ncbi:MAG: M1 family metallopeptidase [Bacteroidota bacterium]
MIPRSPFILTALLLLFNGSPAQDSYPKNEAADVQRYIFNLTLNDDNNEIQGEALITVNFKENAETFTLDLVGHSGEYGMAVTGVFEGAAPANYTYTDDKIAIDLGADGAATRTFKVQYRGVAERGLVIDTTKFGQRSFFGDNWPNLAHHWLPSVDHPYDKAAIEFRITAPEHYDVVATGKKVEESHLGNGLKLTCYQEPAPVALKVVTIGVTKFATQLLGTVEDIAVTAWVYPENRLDGFHDYAVAVKVMEYFIERIGPYSYAKLANMQAKTQWGGLENAGTIAYFENSVTGKNTVEGLIAHEISHQWFGNSVTEDSWDHVWLSEGFATYFTILYQEHVYGNERRKQELALDRSQVIAYYNRKPAPVVDYTIEDPMNVLSINTYQKGGWVLNMLRHRIGDDAFWKGIRLYYKTFRNANALTEDFRRIMEEVSDDDLRAFFDQWIFTAGHPELKWSWQYKKGKVKLQLEQMQEQLYKFPLEIGIVTGDDMKIERLTVDERSATLQIAVDAAPDKVVLDPETWLLFAEVEE